MVIFYIQLDVVFSLKSEFERNFQLSNAIKKLLRHQFLTSVQSVFCDSSFNGLNNLQKNKHY
jgi:hypothetical protein